MIAVESVKSGKSRAGCVSAVFVIVIVEGVGPWVSCNTPTVPDESERFVALVLSFFGVWLGSATAHELKGWRAFLLPVIYVVTLVVAIFFLESVIEGTVLAVDGLLADFGLVPPP